jgi:hypothetical protein
MTIGQSAYETLSNMAVWTAITTEENGMSNPFKRGQAVTFEITSRNGGTGTGRFVGMSENRGRCVVRLENGQKVQPFVSKVQAIDDAQPETGKQRTIQGNTRKPASGNARGRASRHASSTPEPAVAKASKTSGRKVAKNDDSLLMAIMDKLDMILARLEELASVGQDQLMNSSQRRQPVNGPAMDKARSESDSASV